MKRFQLRYELYKLVFPNGKLYFGLSHNALKRFKTHKYHARHNVQLPVYCALRKYGADEVLMQVICAGPRAYIQMLEIACIAIFKTMDRAYGYNAAPGGDLSPMLNPEVVAKVKLSLLKYECSPEHRESLRKASVETEAHKRINTPEAHIKAEATKRANREARLVAGLSLITEETRAKLKAYRPTEETLAKQSKSGRAFYLANPGAHKNSPNYKPPVPFKGPHTEEAKAKVRAYLKLRKEFFAANNILTGAGGHPLNPAHALLWKEWFADGDKTQFTVRNKVA